MTPQERAHLTDQLRQYAEGVVHEWMRIAELDDMNDQPYQVRIGWQNEPNVFVVGEDRYGDEYGRFRLVVQVEDLGHLPPIGPENDPAQQHEALVWHPRPLRDVRKGDVIRPAGTLGQSTVTDRYWPPTPDGSDRGTWHVVPDLGSDKWSFTRDHVVQPGEVWICLDGGAPRNMAPDFAVEILLDPAEIAAIDRLGPLGWDNRVRTS